MGKRTIEVAEAQSQLAELIALAAAGTDVVLTERDTPRARLVAVVPPATRRKAGLHPGSMTTSEDFDAPLPGELWAGSA